MVTFTNIEGRRENSGTWIDTDEVELKALIGCLLFLGAMKQNMMSTTLLFDPLYGQGLVRASIARKSFIQLLTHLRFDDKATRSA